jgi:hypothetical protein
MKNSELWSSMAENLNIATTSLKSPIIELKSNGLGADAR